ncbi:MAG TPA: hypothetical protein PKO28_00395 [Bacilli bacterium]|mgnify:CR=1 FL=1|nr:hypothetical protein [Bacilli bacterium]HPS19306.1 hypothetical protein [Bacilli bacterium]
MKQLLFAILQNTEESHRLFKELHERGYNGTTTETGSISSTLLDDPDFQPMFGNLRQVVSAGFQKNVALYIILDESHVEEVKQLIREATHSFATTRGGMAIIPLVSFEGSF